MEQSVLEDKKDDKKRIGKSKLAVIRIAKT